MLASLERWRNRPQREQGYGPGNVVNLLRLFRGDLRGLDLGRLALRQAYLGGVEAQDASLDRMPLLVVRGHTGTVYDLALSGDGRLLASGSQDGTVRLWEAPGGRLLATLQADTRAGEGHSGGVWSVALSTDGRLLASASFDGTVRLWEAPGGRPLAVLQGHTGPVYGVALSTDGQLLASGGDDGTIRLWDVSSRACLRILRSDRRYERTDIAGLTGVTAAQRAALLALRAVDHQDAAGKITAGLLLPSAS